MTDIKIDYKKPIHDAKTIDELEEIRIQFTGKNGVLSKQYATLKDLPADEKATTGQYLNEIKNQFEKEWNKKKDEIEANSLKEKLATTKVDLNLPGFAPQSGSVHILNQTIAEIEDFFLSLGFSIEDGPEIETDVFNFEYMNMPVGHPARAMHDTFYLSEELLLRTHTSPVQARTMLKKKGKALRIICPGKTYRRDNDDQTHSHQFMQIEGLVIDRGISFANLKWMLEKLCGHLFEKSNGIRIRPSYFPFTEPSVEVDVVLKTADKKEKYIELLGAGMVNKEVLIKCGYNPDKYSGFAFGIGVERVVMVKNKIESIRNFYLNDTRFLKQFKGFTK